jgi:hypothetical protein
MNSIGVPHSGHGVPDMKGSRLREISTLNVLIRIPFNTATKAYNYLPKDAID